MHINNIALPDEIGEKATWHGVEGPAPILWHHRGRALGDDVVVLKFPGAHYWASRGSQGYAPTHFAVCRITNRRPTGCVDLETIVEFPVKLPT